ncbi:BtpA/SgcQ family protein [Clostridium lundense]|uniref:BtpA/SgcQ family protein n=1 Tax=Clostridium lundense TaxID=319475 RepID=UPI0004862416|nr:BtpA/SgcQ family protein [Clostridium lundense]
MSRFNEIFKGKKAIIGMVHLLPLPGTAMFDGDMDKIYEQALFDTKALEEGGVAAIMVENFGDMPYGKELSLEQSTALAAAAAVIKKNTNLSIGIDAAFCDYKAALACAKASGADFVRLAVFVDTVECFAGILEPCCAEALRYRKQINAEEVMIFADIQVKHTHMLIPNVDIIESANVAVSCGADAVIVTGLATGMETPIETVKRVKENVNCPVIIGSGVSAKNIKEQMNIADGAIVGSSLKYDNVVTNKVDINKVKELTQSINK